MILYQILLNGKLHSFATAPAVCLTTLFIGIPFARIALAALEPDASAYDVFIKIYSSTCFYTVFIPLCVTRL